MALTIFPLAAIADSAPKREAVEIVRISRVAYAKIAGAWAVLVGNL
jgi:hypothetical protein